MNSSPIFVVGVPRSGTTLLAAMLGSHSRLSCGGETHVVKALCESTSNILNKNSETDWPQSAANYLKAIIHAGNDIVSNYGLEMDELIHHFNKRPKGAVSLISALPSMLMEKQNKKRWVEKTPAHLPHVATIRRLFPDATIVRIVRDPRDVAISLRKVPWGPGSFFGGLLTCQSYANASEDFFATDNKCITIRYEDLLADPATTMGKVCEAIGEKFEPKMLETSSNKSKVNPCNEPWKEKVGQQIDETRLNVWERELNDLEKMIAESVLGQFMNNYGYKQQFEFRKYVQPCPHVTSEPAVAYLANNGYRFWRVSADEPVSLVALLGDPDEDLWFSGGRWSRVFDALKTVALDY